MVDLGPKMTCFGLEIKDSREKDLSVNKVFGVISGVLNFDMAWPQLK